MSVEDKAVQEGQQRGGRRGGREARRAMRAAPLADDIKPIRPGMEGGRYKPLDDAGIARINEAALDALEQIGLAQPIHSCVEVCTAAGAIMGDDGRLRFPRAMIEDMVAKAARDFPLYGRDPQFDIHPGGTRVRMTVWASFDRGETWPVKRLIHPGAAAYSSLAAGPDGTVYLLFERGEEKLYDTMSVARFNLAWLLEGAGTDTPD